MTVTDNNGVPKGKMRQPEVRVASKPDQPNAERHAALRANWRAGQRWETLVQGCTVWVPVGDNGYAEPTWDAHQEYREMAP